jgi:predicted ABC-type ATPase
MDDPPRLIAVAGPNGAGKSTFASRLLPEEFQLFDYVNADTIARGLSAYDPESVAVQAGRVMLERLDQLATARESFAFETTLSGRTYAKWIRALKDGGYVFHVFFVTLRNADLAIERVKSRVRLGGHSVSDAIIRRRFGAGIRNFFELYRPLADNWSVYDNSTGPVPILVATGRHESELSLVDAKLWAGFQGIQDD